MGDRQDDPKLKFIRRRINSEGAREFSSTGAIAAVDAMPCDDLVNDGIPQRLLAVEVVIERTLREVSSGKNCIDASTLEA